MKVNILEMLLGQVPEAIYFALFMIFTKRLKEKRVLFTILMVIEYLLLIRAIPYNLYSRIGYFVTTFLTLKILYKEKSQITDVFILAIASIILILIDIPLYLVISLFCSNYIVFVVTERIIIFILLILTRYKLPTIQKLYKKLWNRNDKEKKKIKSTTFRSLNVVLFNLSFYALNLIMIYFIFKNSNM